MKMPKRKMNLKFISVVALFLGLTPLYAQQKGAVIDEIVAMVGDEVILKSEVEANVANAKAGKNVAENGDVAAEVIENMLMSKLMKEQAIIDSVVVTEDEVERQLDQRIDQYLRYAGSKEKLEQYFKKTMPEIRNELRDATRDQLIVENMQNEIVKNVKVTPAEVRMYYDNMAKDSLPLMPEKVMIQQISRKPEISQKEKDRIQKQLREYRDEVYKGGSFATLAVLHSEDPGSSNKGGELGYMSRTNLVPEFADVAFNLKPGKISKIVQTEFGFHIIQLIDKKDDKVNVRHILLKPQIEEKYKEKARLQLDSIRTSVLDDKITFEKAAMLYSEDKDTKNNAGLLMNPRTAGAYFQKPQLPATISRNLEGVQEKELSSIFYDVDDRVPSFKFFRVKSLVAPHKANLEEDWEIFENMVIGKKKQDVLNDWVKEKIKDTYVEISKDISKENFRYDWEQK